MILRMLCLGSLICALIPTPASGQVSSDPPQEGRADSLARAEVAGQGAARRRGVSGYFLSSFLGGLPMGFIGPFAVSGEPTSIVLAGGGAAVIVITLSRAADLDIDLPDQLSREIEGSPEYREAFRASYAERLSRRRVRASLLGAGAGTVAGLGTLVWLISQIDDF